MTTKATPSAARRSGGTGSVSHLVSMFVTVMLGLVAGWLALDRWVLADSHEPVPGVRTTTWKRVRDLPPHPETGLARLMATVRTARRYLGPAPSGEELAAYREAGLCDAFYHWLRPEWQEHVDARIADLDRMLDEVADACEAATEAAKRAIRGTEDEFVHRPDRTEEQNREAARPFLERAKAAGDICVSDSYGGAMRSYRIRKERQPCVYELRRQDADLNEIRQMRLHEEISALLAAEGSAVLDNAAMERAWADILARR